MALHICLIRKPVRRKSAVKHDVYLKLLPENEIEIKSVANTGRLLNVYLMPDERQLIKIEIRMGLYTAERTPSFYVMTS